MKTVLEIASENGVSKQAVYQRISKLKDNQLKPFLKKGDKGETLVTAKGEAILKASFSKPLYSTVEQVVDQVLESNNTLSHESEGITSFLKEQIVSLEKQIAVKDEQLSKVLDQNESLLEKLENMQILLKNEQEKNTPRLTGEVLEAHGEKKTFWNKIFG